jgi:hypothetical protein
MDDEVDADARMAALLQAEEDERMARDLQEVG